MNQGNSAVLSSSFRYNGCPGGIYCANGREPGGCRALTADGFRRVVKCRLRRIRDAVLTVRAEDSTKKGQRHPKGAADSMPYTLLEEILRMKFDFPKPIREELEV